MVSNSTRSLQEREAHREWIAGAAYTLLSSYYRPDDPVKLTAAIGKDWADVLEDMPRELIQKARVQYLREEPKRRPTPGDIYQRVVRMLPRPESVQDNTRSPFDMTEEEIAERRKSAKRIMEGFKSGK